MTEPAPQSDACPLVRYFLPPYAVSRHRFIDAERSLAPRHGPLDRGVEAALPPGCRLAFAYPEFGTYEPPRTIRALRADNWLHQHGDPCSAQALALRADMLEVFRRASAAGQHRVIATGALRVARALDHLPGVEGMH